MLVVFEFQNVDGEEAKRRLLNESLLIDHLDFEKYLNR